MKEEMPIMTGTDNRQLYLNTFSPVNQVHPSMWRIGLLGPSGAGKSTATVYLQEKYGYNRLRLSQPIKDFIALLRGYSMDYDNDPLSFGPRSEEDRTLMQNVGDEVRKVLEDAFVAYLLRQVESQSPTNKVVVPDVRYLNEARLLKQAGFCIIYLKRSSEAHLTPAHSGHPSETQHRLIPADLTLHAGNIPNLLSRLDALVGTHADR
jgi:hypothetical protein